MTHDPPVAGWNFKIWHDKLGRAVLLLIALAAVAAVLWPGVISIAILVLLVILFLMILYFFRNPARAALNEPGLVVGPCDGEVVDIVAVPEQRYLQEKAIRISVFLSVMDVHIQRAPIAGRVVLVERKPGEFLQAFRPEASEVNERISMVIESLHGRILIQQIAGILARRCVNFARNGEELRTGQRFGLIKFGSRVDLYLPPEARILVAKGDQVYGGLTPVARFEQQGGT